MDQGYSEQQDFSPFPLLETYSFFSNLVFYDEKIYARGWADQKRFQHHFDLPQAQLSLLMIVYNTKLEKKNVCSNSGKGEKSCCSE